MTKIVKDSWVINCQLNKYRDSLSEIKDKLTFIRRGIITLIYNARLLNIEFK